MRKVSNLIIVPGVYNLNFQGNVTWRLIFYPGFYIFMTILALSFVGDSLRNTLTPG